MGDAIQTNGSIRFASFLKGVIEALRNLTWLSSTSDIEAAYRKVEDLAVDAKLLMLEGPKRAVIVDKIIEAAAYFDDRWRVQNKTGHTVAERTANLLERVFTILEVPENAIGTVADIPEQEPAGIGEPVGPTGADAEVTSEDVRDVDPVTRPDETATMSMMSWKTGLLAAAAVAALALASSRIKR